MNDEKLFYVISVKHTQRCDRYITLWGPDDRGYRQRTNTAGKYPESVIRAHLAHYYNTGESNIAIPCEIVDSLAVAGDPAHFIGCDPAKGDPLVLLNDRDTWHKLILNTIEPPPYACKPQYPGARRRKE